MGMFTVHLWPHGPQDGAPLPASVSGQTRPTADLPLTPLPSPAQHSKTAAHPAQGPRGWLSRPPSAHPLAPAHAQRPDVTSLHSWMKTPTSPRLPPQLFPHLPAPLLPQGQLTKQGQRSPSLPPELPAHHAPRPRNSSRTPQVTTDLQVAGVSSEPSPQETPWLGSFPPASLATAHGPLACPLLSLPQAVPC